MSFCSPEIMETLNCAGKLIGVGIISLVFLFGVFLCIAGLLALIKGDN